MGNISTLSELEDARGIVMQIQKDLDKDILPDYENLYDDLSISASVIKRHKDKDLAKQILQLSKKALSLDSRPEKEILGSMDRRGRIFQIAKSVAETDPRLSHEALGLLIEAQDKCEFTPLDKMKIEAASLDTSGNNMRMNVHLYRIGTVWESPYDILTDIAMEHPELNDNVLSYGGKIAQSPDYDSSEYVNNHFQRFLDTMSGQGNCVNKVLNLADTHIEELDDMGKILRNAIENNGDSKKILKLWGKGLEHGIIKDRWEYNNETWQAFSKLIKSAPSKLGLQMLDASLQEGLFSCIPNDGITKLLGYVAEKKPSLNKTVVASISNLPDDPDISIVEKRKLLYSIINQMDYGDIGENRLSDLKGVSINDLTDSYLETVQAAADAYDTSNLSGLLQVAVDAPNTPAFDLLSGRYRETYSNDVVDGIAERARDIIKLPYKKMFFEQITQGHTNAPEANFLDEFTDRIRSLAMDKYNQQDWYTSISEASKIPEFMKETDQVWNKMFAEADKYATRKPNSNNNAYIRQMFPDKAEKLHEFVATQKNSNFAEVLDETIKYHLKIGKMRAAINEYCKDNRTSLNGNLHFDLVDAGIETKKEAKRCLDIWQASNERPDRYGSPYNDYSIREIAHIAKSNVMQDWMYPVMMDAVKNDVLTISEGRMPSEKALFDCCKAWKVCPTMPQRLAKEVGTYSLKGRMLAGAIFEHMCKEGNTQHKEWSENKELHQQFYKEFNRAQKMSQGETFKQYIPNTAVNRKRLIAIGIEEKGIENTSENFKKLYNQVRENGIFEKMLAKPEDARTTFSARLLVETARRKSR